MPFLALAFQVAENAHFQGFLRVSNNRKISGFAFSWNEKKHGFPLFARFPGLFFLEFGGPGLYGLISRHVIWAVMPFMCNRDDACRAHGEHDLAPDALRGSIRLRRENIHTKGELGSATGRMSFEIAEVHAMVTRAFWAPTNLMDLSYNRLQECTMATRRVPLSTA
mgnify:CR=1 FL=1